MPPIGLPHPNDHSEAGTETRVRVSSTRSVGTAKFASIDVVEVLSAHTAAPPAIVPIGAHGKNPERVMLRGPRTWTSERGCECARGGVGGVSALHVAALNYMGCDVFG
jgi:hypothetical protein